MQVHYCKGWFRARKRFVELWDEKKARRAYDKRTLHTVLFGDSARPEAFAEFNKDYIGVEFLDERLRNHVAYQFTEQESCRMFCQMVVIRRYDGTSDLVASGTIYVIKPDGTVMAEREDFPSDGTKYRKFGKTDPSIYWEAYPKFGEYESIVRPRPIPVVTGPETIFRYGPGTEHP